MGCKIITIFSNKGGVGKTFITVNLGTALALAEKKVLMIDFDFQAGQDMARMLNLSPRYSIVDVLDQLDRMEDPKTLLLGLSNTQGTPLFNARPTAFPSEGI